MLITDRLKQAIQETNLKIKEWVDVNNLSIEDITTDDVRSLLFSHLRREVLREYIAFKYVKKYIHIHIKNGYIINITCSDISNCNNITAIQLVNAIGILTPNDFILKEITKLKDSNISYISFDKIKQITF